MAVECRRVACATGGGPHPRGARGARAAVGHLAGAAVAGGPAGRRGPCGRRHVHALKRTAGRRIDRGRNGALPLASRLLLAPDGRSDRSSRAEPAAALGGDRTGWPGAVRAGTSTHRWRRGAGWTAGRDRHPRCGRGRQCGRRGAAPRGLRPAVGACRSRSRRHLRPSEPLEGVPCRVGAGGMDPAPPAGLLREPRHRADSGSRAFARSGAPQRPPRVRRRPAYGALRIATGSTPRRLAMPGADHDHVRTLRSLADCRRIIALAKSAERAVVVGAGFIGVETTAGCGTREPHIFAAGDIARWPRPAPGRAGACRALGDRAQQHGQAFARNIGGTSSDTNAPHAGVPFFWTSHFRARVSVVGHASRWDRVEMDGDARAGDMAGRYLRDGRVVAVATIGRDRDSVCVAASVTEQFHAAARAS
jgi:hypothetical protein